MARQLLVPTQITQAGVAPPSNMTPDSGGIKLVNNGNVFIEVDNSDTVSHTITFQIPYTVGGFTLQNKVVTVPLSATNYKIGPFSPLYFDQPQGVSDAGEIYLDFDVPADFHVRAYQL